MLATVDDVTNHMQSSDVRMAFELDFYEILICGKNLFYYADKYNWHLAISSIQASKDFFVVIWKRKNETTV